MGKRQVAVLLYSRPLTQKQWVLCNPGSVPMMRGENEQVVGRWQHAQNLAQRRQRTLTLRG